MDDKRNTGASRTALFAEEYDRWNENLEGIRNGKRKNFSFLFIAIYWVNHHRSFHDAERINVKVL